MALLEWRQIAERLFSDLIEEGEGNGRRSGGDKRRPYQLSQQALPTLQQSTPMMMLGPSTFHGKRVSYWNSCRILRLLLRRHALSMIATLGGGSISIQNSRPSQGINIPFWFVIHVREGNNNEGTMLFMAVDGGRGQRFSRVSSRPQNGWRMKQNFSPRLAKYVTKLSSMK